MGDSFFFVFNVSSSKLQPKFYETFKVIAKDHSNKVRFFIINFLQESAVHLDSLNKVYRGFDYDKSLAISTQHPLFLLSLKAVFILSVLDGLSHLRLIFIFHDVPVFYEYFS